GAGWGGRGEGAGKGPAASARFETTRAMSAGNSGLLAASMRADMFDPRPEMSTATRARLIRFAPAHAVWPAMRGKGCGRGRDRAELRWEPREWFCSWRTCVAGVVRRNCATADFEGIASPTLVEQVVS